MEIIKSFTDTSIEYNVNLDELTCTCPDFSEVRKSYDKNHPFRLCKHLIHGLIGTNAIEKHPQLLFFKQEIEDYSNRKIGFPTNYIFKDLDDLKILYIEDASWIKIYDSDGNKACYNGSRFACDQVNFNLDEIEYTFIRIDTGYSASMLAQTIEQALYKLPEEDKLIMFPQGFEIETYSSFENNDYQTMELSASTKLLNTNRKETIFDYTNEDIENDYGLKAYIWLDLTSLYSRLKNYSIDIEKENKRNEKKLSFFKKLFS